MPVPLYVVQTAKQTEPITHHPERRESIHNVVNENWSVKLLFMVICDYFLAFSFSSVFPCGSLALFEFFNCNHSPNGSSNGKRQGGRRRWPALEPVTVTSTTKIRCTPHWHIKHRAHTISPQTGDPTIITYSQLGRRDGAHLISAGMCDLVHNRPIRN